MFNLTDMLAALSDTNKQWRSAFIVSECAVHDTIELNKQSASRDAKRKSWDGNGAAKACIKLKATHESDTWEFELSSKVHADIIPQLPL